MARLLGDIEYTGTIDGLCFYKMYDSCFVRTKSSLTAKRFWKDTAVEGSRKSCSLLARASSIASAFYKTYPTEKRTKGLFNEMTGRVKLWLKEGKSEEEALLLLEQNYPLIQMVIKKEKKVVKKIKAVAIKKKEKLFVVLINVDFIPYHRKRKRGKLYCLK
jgi:hypothetical protein